jgi:hypothetical protein
MLSRTNGRDSGKWACVRLLGAGLEASVVSQQLGRGLRRRDREADEGVRCDDAVLESDATVAVDAQTHIIAGA